MHAEEPSLLDHLKESRSKVFAEGGLSFVIFAGTIKNEADMAEALSAHRKVVVIASVYVRQLLLLEFIGQLTSLSCCCCCCLSDSGGRGE